jgi:hypothetical protein
MRFVSTDSTIYAADRLNGAASDLSALERQRMTCFAMAWPTQLSASLEGMLTFDLRELRRWIDGERNGLLITDAKGKWPPKDGIPQSHIDLAEKLSDPLNDLPNEVYPGEV